MKYDVIHLLLFLSLAFAFHDCVQPRKRALARRGLAVVGCQGGLCMGMHDGPHENGNESYPAGDAESGYTSVYAEMTVPELPQLQDGICYYLWTDVFFGDMSFGRMNQFVPQLILGNALSGSTGPPLYVPTYGTYDTWHFGAHYFFEVYNATTGNIDAKAAYGTLYPAHTGETLYTQFQATSGPTGPEWTLTMGALGDPLRVSVVRVDQPYMGLGADWPQPTTSWGELNYTNVRAGGCTPGCRISIVYFDAQTQTTPTLLDVHQFMLGDLRRRRPSPPAFVGRELPR
jgi:hypothetical protein